MGVILVLRHTRHDVRVQDRGSDTRLVRDMGLSSRNKEKYLALETFRDRHVSRQGTLREIGYWVFLDEIEIEDRRTHTTKTKTESIEQIQVQDNISPKSTLEREIG